MNPEEQRRRFERLALPHLDAAFNLARWLTRNDHDAEDVVQDAFIRALRYVDGFRGDNARSWLLQIVRNTCFTWMKRNRPVDVLHDDEADAAGEQHAPPSDEPLAMAIRHAERVQLDQAIGGLPVVYREVLVLRELEDCSYDDIATIVGIPLGTVMSRLHRARRLMRTALSVQLPQPSQVTSKSVTRINRDGGR